MPPKARFRREEIVNAALDIAREKGIDAVTARSVAKVWDDGNDQDGARPDHVTVYLMAGSERIAEYELSEKNGWTYTAEDLPVYDGGQAVKYSWQEEPVPG